MNTDNIHSLIQLAKFAGGRFDLVQAGGGNVSCKLPTGEILVKVSGISMSEMASIDQCGTLITQQVRDILENESVVRAESKSLKENTAQSLLNAANQTPHKKPSIETFLHVMLHTFTLHTHPIAVNHLVIRKDARKVIEQFFPEALFVDYATPGVELAIELKKAITQCEEEVKIVFLKNHGLLVSAPTAEEVQSLTQAVVTKIERILGINYHRYHLATEIARLFDQLTTGFHVAYLSEDQKIQKIWAEKPTLLSVWPTSPDMFVFNGILPCELTELDTKELIHYFDEYGFYPKVVRYQQYLFFVNQTIRKAKEMEEVFKFHLMALFHAEGEIDSLSHEELKYLSGWEAEKYRQGV